MKETVSGMLTGLIVSIMSPRKKVMHNCQQPSDMLIGYVIISLGHYLDSGFFFQSSHGLYPFILFAPSLSFCHVQGHHKTCCCSCLWRMVFTHCISMVDIHLYKIITAVQAGKTFMIKSLNHHSYKSRLVSVNLSGTTCHLRGLKSWATKFCMVVPDICES